MEQEVGWRIGATGAVLRLLFHAIVTKRELSQKEKLSICWSVFVPTLAFGHERWVIIERLRSWIKADKIGFLKRVAGVFLSSAQSSLTDSELRWFRHLVRMLSFGGVPGTFSGKEAPGQTQDQVKRFYRSTYTGMPLDPQVRTG